jgi:enoyl-CoA hydratase
VGRKLAFEMFSMGRSLGAGEALDAGLLNRVVEPGEERNAALQIAAAWAKANPNAMAAAKRLFYGVADLSFTEAMEQGRRVNEEMRAFREQSR